MNVYDILLTLIIFFILFKQGRTFIDALMLVNCNYLEFKAICCESTGYDKVPQTIKDNMGANRNWSMNMSLIVFIVFYN